MWMQFGVQVLRMTRAAVERQTERPTRFMSAWGADAGRVEVLKQWEGVGGAKAVLMLGSRTL